MAFLLQKPALEGPGAGEYCSPRQTVVKVLLALQFHYRMMVSPRQEAFQAAMFASSLAAAPSTAEPAPWTRQGIMWPLVFALQEEECMRLFHTAVGAAALSVAVLAGTAAPAFAQLRPPEVKGLRGAPFPSMNPP